MSAVHAVVVCPSCNAKLRTSASGGKNVRCPKCKNAFQPNVAVSSGATAEGKSAAASKPVRIRCGKCSANLSFKNIAPGAKFKCPKCSSIQRVGEAKKSSATDKKTPAAPATALNLPARTEDTVEEAFPVSVKPSTSPGERDADPPAVAKPKAAPATVAHSAAKPKTTTSRYGRKKDRDDAEPLISPKLVLAAIAVLFLGLAGGAWFYFAGELASTRGEIHGEVTLDGAPLAEGFITFRPADGKGVVAAGPITDGKYQIARDQGPNLGDNIVVISSQKKTGRQFREMGILMDEKIEAIAERFNTVSTLRHDVKAGSNTANFKVESQ